MKIRTTHVGSLPRPNEMISRQLKKESITDDDLAGFVSDTVNRQLKTGLTVINNGELPRSDYISATVSRISGFDDTCHAPIPQDMEEVPDYSRKFSGRNGLIALNPRAKIELPACSSELEFIGGDSLRKELDMLIRVFKENKNKYPDNNSELFFTAPSPGTIALFLENHFYPDYKSYLEKLGEILQKEYEIISSYDLLLQVDCPDLAMGRHTAYKHKNEDEFLKLIDINAAVLNNALSNINPESCRAHICWGNYPGTHHCDIGLDIIYPVVTSLLPRYISLESCNHRHSHEAELFQNRSFPEDKVLMPGVIDTTSTTVEHPDLVARQLLYFANILGSDRVIGSTDCGFASTASAGSVSGEIAWLKLAALVEGAKKASEKL